MNASCTRLTRLVTCFGLLAGALLSAPTGRVHARAAMAAAPSFAPRWLQIDPRDPRNLYLGGPAPCSGASSDCSTWAFHSTNGGATWSSLRAALGTLDPGICQEATEPFTFAPGSATIYTSVTESCGSPNSTNERVQRSTDGGLSWRSLGHSGGNYGAGNYGVAISPAAPRYLYAIAYPGGGNSNVDVSSDGGAGWRLVALPAASGGGTTFLTSLAPDPTRARLVYANSYTPGIGAAGEESSTDIWRSGDGGATWTAIAPPTESPALKTFGVAFDPHLPGVLIGRTDDRATPADRRYLSRDGGATWQIGRCPGDHNGHCPAFTVDNAFGAGQSYALVDGGVYAFQGGGPASAYPVTGLRLPLRTADLSDVAAAGTARGPVYLLGAHDAAHPAGRLYRSTDGGATWQDLGGSLRDAAFPNLAAPRRAAGALMVQATLHSVAAPFVATYRRLGLRATGYPITEAYREGGVLTQTFEHLQLEARGTAVTVANLGDEVLSMRLMQGQDQALSGYLYGAGSVKPAPSSASVYYFPRTHHTLRGDLLRYWQQHGGMATLGAPLTEVLADTNGDGSGRTYQLQWFQKGRLERHPELRDPHYAILLGLVGREALGYRGWT